MCSRELAHNNGFGTLPEKESSLDAPAVESTGHTEIWECEDNSRSDIILYIYIAEHSTVLTTLEIVLFFPSQRKFYVQESHWPM